MEIMEVPPNQRCRTARLSRAGADCTYGLYTGGISIFTMLRNRVDCGTLLITGFAIDAHNPSNLLVSNNGIATDQTRKTD